MLLQCVYAARVTVQFANDVEVVDKFAGGVEGGIGDGGGAVEFAVE